MPIDYMQMLREFHLKYRHHEFDGYTVETDVVELRIKLIKEYESQERKPSSGK
mgnify:CR=1 FL=1